MTEPSWFTDVLPGAMCSILVPDCVHAFADWLMVMGVPIGVAVVGGLIFPRWRDMLLVGAFCFLVHEAGGQLRWFVQFGEFYSPFTAHWSVTAAYAAFYAIVMSAIASVAHAAKRLLLWVGARMAPQPS